MTVVFIAFIASVIAVSAFFFVRQGNANESSGAVDGWPNDQAAQEVKFWELIERTKLDGKGEEAQLNELRTQLGKLSSNDLEKFISVFDRLMYQSYSWDLWGAAYTIRGGASDDSFEDFRKWLISRGTVCFHQAIEHPDNLASLIDKSYEGDATFEEFSYIPLEIWADKTGKKAADLPKEKASLYPAEPFGEPFKEDNDHLSKRYPKLWKRFGGHPLG